jgi:hypothetical protein
MGFPVSNLLTLNFENATCSEVVQVDRQNYIFFSRGGSPKIIDNAQLYAII